MTMQQEISAALRSLVLRLLGRDANDPSFVRTTWLSAGQPGWKIDEDVCFLSLLPETSDVERQRNICPVKGRLVQESLRRVTADFIFYGPAAWDNAQTLRDGFFLPESTEYLRSRDLGLISDVPAVQRAPELFNGCWWERADLTVGFYVRQAKITDFVPVEAISLEVISNH